VKRKSIFLILLLLHVHHLVSQEIAPGIVYTRIIRHNPNQSIHMLTVDPAHADIRIGIADNKCASARTTSDIAKKHNAIAAINGGFFDFGCNNKFRDTVLKVLDCFGLGSYNAYPMFTLHKNNRYYSLSHIFSGAISWNNIDQKPIFSAIKTQATLMINETKYSVSEFNKPHPKKATLYSRTYNFKTPAFHKYVDEIVISNNRVTKIYRNSRGQRKIPKNGYVYVLPNRYKKKTQSIKEGDSTSLNFINYHKENAFFEEETLKQDSYTQESTESMENILASTPLLIHNNSIPTYLKNFTTSFYTKKHPRTAVGVLANGNWIFVVVDGRQKDAQGFSILQLARFMKKLGCTEALNLDGGGTATMVIKDKVVNSVSGREYSLVKKERPISNALVIIPKK
jgi:uncharacterized protein YigE (DUF2233 family)